MCGIAGIVYDSRDKQVDASALKRMTDALVHRGPDAEGSFVRGNVGLGHRRLSIIDISCGHQPIVDEERGLAIVFNGEIYNYLDIQADLVSRGYAFKTRSDTEVILRAYQEFGRACVDRLRGMFAFAVYDAAKGLVFLARDRMGKKPIYYYHDGHVFLFASEIKALLKSGHVSAEVNTRMLDSFLAIGYVPGRETLFKGIVRLEPGHTLEVTDGRLRTFRYWNLAEVPTRPVPYEEALERVRSKLIESIRIRLMSEVPLGVFLSGGLDSSTITCLLSEMSGSPVKTFSLGYRSESESELGYARVVADAFRTEHHEFYLEAEDLFDSMKAFLASCEEPIADASAVALQKLARFAKPFATVLLSGEGADEAFAGYGIYATGPRMEELHRAARLIPKTWVQFCAGHLPEKAVKYLDWITEPFADRVRSLSYDLSASVKRRMYSEQFRAQLDNSFDEFFGELHREVAGETLQKRMQYIDCRSWLVDNILLKSDRMTMASSVELRAPFLDQELISLAFSLPDEFKLNRGRGKFILKEIMKDKLPPEVLARPKKGWPLPLNAWFAGQLNGTAKDLLLSSRALSRGYFQPSYIARILEDVKKGHDLGRRILSLCLLELWHQRYIDRVQPAAEEARN